ncbi:MAG: hypothetical protein CME31_11085 [Gimesia sp.]|nr:hypothetical protein [Gimesia sp.]
MANKFIIEIQTKGFNKATGDLDNLKKKTDQYGNSSKKMRLHTSGVRRELGKLRNNLLLISFAFGAVATAVNRTVAAYRKQLEAETRLRASLRNVASASEDGADKLMQLASALQQTTTFGDEQIISGQAMLATFQLNEDAIAALTPRMLDMAAAMGTGGDGLTTIALQLGKAFTGQIGALSRSGVLIDKLGLSIAKSQGPASEFAFLIEQLDKNFEGLAEELGQTTIGRIDQLKNKISDINEELGKTALPIQLFGVQIKKFVLESLSWWVLFFKEWSAQSEGGIKDIEMIPEVIQAVNNELNNLTIDIPEFGTPSVPENLQTTIDLIKEQLPLWKLLGDEAIKAITQVGILTEEQIEKEASLHPLLRKRRELDAEIEAQSRIQTATLEEGLIITTAETVKYLELQIKRQQIVQAIAQSEMKATAEMFSAFSQLAGQNKDRAILAATLARASAIISMYAGIQKAYEQGGVLGFVTGATILAQGLANIGQINAQLRAIQSAATGADFITSGPQLLLVGENPGGKERVQVTPLSSQNVNGPDEKERVQILSILSQNINELKKFATGGSVLDGVDTPTGIQKFATGGSVLGGVDTVPAMLQPGEFVLSKSAVQSIGVDTATRINAGQSGGITINVQGNMIGNESFVRDVLIPEISNAQRLNLA